MHEMAIAEGMLEIVEEAARTNDAARVASVCLELGALSHVEVDALRFCFDAVTRGGPAAGAQLHVVMTPGEGWCMPCGTRVPVAALGDGCPRCGSYQVEITGGTEMRVREIEIA
jgi:hydrogenase nickel incorporation protein HypA/HybF